MFSEIQRQMLREAAKNVHEDSYDGADNPELEVVIAAIRRQSPEKFHTDETLRLRRFVNEPRPFVMRGKTSRGIRNHGFLYHASPETIRGWAES